MPNHYTKSAGGFWHDVPLRWLEMIGYLTTLAGVVSFGVWARHIHPPLPWWIIGVVIGGVLLIVFLSFLAYDHVRVERDEAKRKLLDPFLKEAQGEHFTEIEELTRKWFNSLPIPLMNEVQIGTPTDIDTVKSDFHFVHLKEHLPFNELWQEFTEFDNKIHQYLDLCKNLRSQINQSWRREDTKPTPNFAEPILKLIAEDKDKLRYLVAVDLKHPIEDEKYRILNVEGVEVVRGLEVPNPTSYFQDLNAEQSSKHPLALEYQKIVEDFMHRNTTNNVRELLKRLTELQASMRSCLEAILAHRDYIIHLCKGCPINQEPIKPLVSHKGGSQN